MNVSNTKNVSNASRKIINVFTAAARWEEVVVLSKSYIFMCMCETILSKANSIGQNSQGGCQNGQEGEDFYQKVKDDHKNTINIIFKRR